MTLSQLLVVIAVLTSWSMKLSPWELNPSTLIAPLSHPLTSQLCDHAKLPETGFSRASSLFFSLTVRVVIFFSLTEAPLPDPTLTPPNGPETDAKTNPKRTETDPKWTEIKLSGVGLPGGLSGWRGCGGCKGKRKSLV